MFFESRGGGDRCSAQLGDLFVSTAVSECCEGGGRRTGGSVGVGFWCCCPLG
jgi:hypothetical protein